MGNYGNVKHMKAQIAELEKEKSVLLSKVQAMEDDREKMRNELALTRQEMLTARRQAHENMSRLASLREEKNENETRMRNTVISTRKECSSLSILVERLKSRVAEKALENRVLNRKLAARCEPKVERPAESKLPKVGREKPRGKYYLAEIQLEKIPHCLRKELVHPFSDRFFNLTRAVDQVYRDAMERKKAVIEATPRETGISETKVGETEIRSVKDSAEEGSSEIPSKGVLPKGILRPPGTCSESKDDNNPFWLGDVRSMFLKRSRRKVRFSRN